MKTVLITGADGQLGRKIRDIHKNFASRFSFTDINQLDITDKISIENYFEKNKPDIIINCAAYTAVDNAEDDYNSAKKVNCDAVKYLAEASIKYHSKIIHISTDYVFDGNANTPYSENSQTKPVNKYGQSKLLGEKALVSINPNSIIIRTSWLYSEYGNNFLKTILRLSKEKEYLKVVFDQVGTPTYAGCLADTIMHIVTEFTKNDFWKPGIYNFSNEGVCSWYDFAFMILKNRSIKIPVYPVLSKEFPTKAKRPNYSVLDKTKLCDTYNVLIQHWSEALVRCIDNNKVINLGASKFI